MKSVILSPSRAYLRQIAAAVCYVLIGFTSSFAHSQNDFYLDRIEHFGIQEDDFDQMHIIPTSMMETDTLFLAAKLERDTSMSMSQRLMNNRWLLSDKKHSYSGTEALRRYLRLYFLANWKSKFKSSENKRGIYLPATKVPTTSQFTSLSNYQLKVSDDKFNLRFKYKFK